ncbi:MAG: hypothetical protein M0R70_10670 [Nitrospirae bacterium]|nr:hypothetical protein [Nitrospirota bacterium]
MYKHLIIAIFPIFFLFPAIVPQLLQAQVSQHSDVNVKNFPETQQIKGDVHVNNFPELQQIKGSVSIEGTTKFITREGLVVPTSQRAELPEMVYAGTIETDGFTSLLISLQGEMRSEVFSSGTIGVLLIPDEMPILRILRDAKRIQFPIECKVQAKSGDPIYFESEQVQQRIAFTRYKMYLYNTANKSAEANVYLYLSNSPIVSAPGISNN